MKSSALVRFTEDKLMTNVLLVDVDTAICIIFILYISNDGIPVPAAFGP